MLVSTDVRPGRVGASYLVRVDDLCLVSAGASLGCVGDLVILTKLVRRTMRRRETGKERVRSKCIRVRGGREPRQARQGGGEVRDQGRWKGCPGKAARSRGAVELIALFYCDPSAPHAAQTRCSRCPRRTFKVETSLQCRLS